MLCFGVKDKNKKLEKTRFFYVDDSKLSVDSILRFLLLMLQYLDVLYSISWYLLGRLLGMLSNNFVGIESIRGYDSNSFERSY